MTFTHVARRSGRSHLEYNNGMVYAVIGVIVSCFVMMVMMLGAFRANRCAAHQQIPIGLSILGRHDNVNDGINACGQIN